MLFVSGLLVVVTASSIAIFVNDNFHLGGYFTEDEQTLQPATIKELALR